MSSCGHPNHPWYPNIALPLIVELSITLPSLAGNELKSIVGVGVGAAISLGVGAGVSLGTGEGALLGGAAIGIFVPLFQISFLPDLMQVNFFPRYVLVLPALGHEVPAFTAASEFGVAKIGSDIAREIRRICHERLMALMLVRAYIQINSNGSTKTRVIV